MTTTQEKIESQITSKSIVQNFFGYSKSYITTIDNPMNFVFKKELQKSIMALNNKSVGEQKIIIMISREFVDIEINDVTFKMSSQNIINVRFEPYIDIFKSMNDNSKNLIYEIKLSEQSKNELLHTLITEKYSVDKQYFFFDNNEARPLTKVIVPKNIANIFAENLDDNSSSKRYILVDEKGDSLVFFERGSDKIYPMSIIESVKKDIEDMLNVSNLPTRYSDSVRKNVFDEYQKYLLYALKTDKMFSNKEKI